MNARAWWYLTLGGGGIATLILTQMGFRAQERGYRKTLAYMKRKEQRK